MKFVAYYRVSTVGQGKSGLGLEAQRNIVQSYCEGELVKEFTEIASGKSLLRRPLLEEAIAFCIENGYTLIVAKADRLSRDQHDATGIAKRLNNKLFCCDCPDPDLLGLFFWFAQREREIISLRTKKALESRKKRIEKQDSPELTREGKTKFNGASKGVDTTKARSLALEVRKDIANEKAQKIIELARDLRKGGDSLTTIAEKLNRYGYTTSRGKSYTPTAIKRVLERLGEKP